jgi:protein SCO1/2
MQFTNLFISLLYACMMNSFVWFAFTLLILLNACNGSKSTPETPPASQQRSKPSSLNTFKAAPQFSGINLTNTVFSSSQMQDKVWLAYFFFTSCGGPCPVVTANIATIQKDVAGKPLHIVGISVDPETDTPNILAAYAKRYNADTTLWRMVQMPLDSVKSVAIQGFLLPQGDMKNAEHDPNLHSTRIVLIDPKGMIRGYFDGTDQEALQRLRTGISELLAERP